MTITRHEPTKIYSKVVEANGLVFTAGIVADKVEEDVKGQTRQILAEIDRLLGLCGTSKANLVSATIWLADIRSRDAMNEVWRLGGRPEPSGPCLRRGQARRPAHAGRDRHRRGKVAAGLSPIGRGRRFSGRGVGGEG